MVILFQFTSNIFAQCDKLILKKFGKIKMET